MAAKYIILLIFSITLPLYGDDYHSFTNQTGQMIKARIISVDIDAKTVTLEKENRKKATVPISIFTEPSQDFILSSVRTKETPSTPETPPQVKLTKNEVETIAKQYVEGWNNKDFDSIAHLFHKPDKKMREQYTHYLTKFKSTKVGTVYEDSFTVKLTFFGSGSGTNPWCHLTPEGKIKYDTYLRPHPISIAVNALTIFNSGDDINLSEGYQKIYLNVIKHTGVPTFDFTVGNNESATKNYLEQTINWVLENGTTYDTSEPNVCLNPKAFKGEEKRLKRLNQQL